MMRHPSFLIFLGLLYFTFCDEKEKSQVEEILNSVLKTRVSFYNLTEMETNFSPDRNKSRVFFSVESEGKDIFRSAILTGFPSTELGDRIVTVSGLFQNQKTFDEKVIPLLEKLKNEVGDESSRFWIKSYGTKGYVLVYEDVVKEKNYGPSIGCFLNFKECELVLNTLAKFHAMTAVLYERGDLTTDDIDRSLFERNGERIKNYHDVQVEKFIDSIDKSWGPEWSNASNYVKARLQNMTEQFKLYHQKSEKSFNVLNQANVHGKIVLFKHNEETKNPTSVLFTPSMDYFYNTPAFDLNMFLMTSPNLDLMFSKRDEFVSIYHRQLVEELKKFGYKGTKAPAPDLKYLKSELERLKNYGIYNAIANFQYFCQDRPEYNITKAIDEAWTHDKVVVLEDPLYGENYISIMKKILTNEINANPL